MTNPTPETNRFHHLDHHQYDVDMPLGYRRYFPAGAASSPPAPQEGASKELFWARSWGSQKKHKIASMTRAVVLLISMAFAAFFGFTPITSAVLAGVFSSLFSRGKIATMGEDQGSRQA
ncbi:hypothetical protein G3I59_14430 [Amycolatopsis rubida]|uniref:Uncharacterized protein n=1 Tax=Amycolatopsis rubida TaxID=112413 RepID=A0ABX0BMQ0_9PSEU|nr:MULTISPECIES: hypothetical protein [Amycolatopsis]MYW91760.1 hypothetical protein [Amycolatopsis rubida]NEC56745.1 hypothetical protein [Amycolatopsis rubida]OAP21682.1 hypothetical protein A4R44_07475 [Amycolatopsis sp. M39]